MCGLFAGVGKLSGNRMVALGSMNEDRGTDSVGIAYLADGQVRIAKVAERPCVALNTTLRKDVTAAAVSGMFIGHTRQATQGDVTDANAHPFFDMGVAFAHNGIILNDEDFGKYAVDSQSLIHGIKAKDFSKYEGGIALVWLEDGKLRAYRCGNPLYRGRHGGATYLASEKDQLAAIGCTHVKPLGEGLIYTFEGPGRVTTERVNRNETGYSYKGTSWEDYSCYGSKESAYKFPTSLSVVDDKRDVPPMKGREDFRTWKDDILRRDKERMAEFVDACDMCGKVKEVSEGYCLECLVWLDDLRNKDVPAMSETRGR